MKFRLLFIAFSLVGFFGQSFAQEELLGKSMNEASSYMKTIDPDFKIIIDTHSSGYPKALRLSHRSFQRWGKFASLDMEIDSLDRVADIIVVFPGIYPGDSVEYNEKFSKGERKLALNELKKKFGKPHHIPFSTKCGKVEQWKWEDKVGSYTFQRQGNEWGFACNEK